MLILDRNQALQHTNEYPISQLWEKYKEVYGLTKINKQEVIKFFYYWLPLKYPLLLPTQLDSLFQYISESNFNILLDKNTYKDVYRVYDNLAKLNNELGNYTELSFPLVVNLDQYKRYKAIFDKGTNNPRKIGKFKISSINQFGELQLTCLRSNQVYDIFFINRNKARLQVGDVLYCELEKPHGTAYTWTISLVFRYFSGNIKIKINK